MALKLNAAGEKHAKQLIQATKYDATTAWSFSAADGNALLGDGGDDWREYSRWFLGIDAEADAETKAAYAYPFGKRGRVYRKALIAIRSRAAKQNETEIYDASGRLIAKIDEIEAAQDKALRARYGADAIGVQILTLPFGGVERTVLRAAKATSVIPSSELPDDQVLLRITTEQRDRMNDVVVAAGMDTRLYMQNPVVLWSHYSEMPPIARALSLSLTTRDGAQGWDALTQFHCANELSRDVLALYKRGYLSQTSIGFMPIAWVDEKLDGKGLNDGGPVAPGDILRRYTRTELVEYSACSIGMNPYTTTVERSVEDMIRRAVDAGAIRPDGAYAKICGGARCAGTVAAAPDPIADPVADPIETAIVEGIAKAVEQISNIATNNEMTETKAGAPEGVQEKKGRVLSRANIEALKGVHGHLGEAVAMIAKLIALADMPADEPDGDECPTCGGTGKVNGEDCPDCGGTGTMKALKTQPITEIAQPAPSPSIAEVEAEHRADYKRLVEEIETLKAAIAAKPAEPPAPKAVPLAEYLAARGK